MNNPVGGGVLPPMRKALLLTLFLVACGRVDPYREEYTDFDEPVDGGVSCMSQLGNSLMGRGVDLTPGQSADILRFVSDRRGEGGEIVDNGPSAIGIHVSATAPDNDTTTSNGNLIIVNGALEWGVNGATHFAEIDIMKGVSFALAADYVKLRATNNNPVSGNPLFDNVNVKAGACIGSFDAPPPTITRMAPGGGIAPAGTFSVVVPPFAKSVRIARSDSAGTGVAPSCTLSLSAGIGVGVYDNIVLIAAQNSDAIPLGGRARIATLTNTSLVGIQAALIFDLYL